MTCPLCLAAPKSARSSASGGRPPPAADCTGTWSVDLNAYFHDELAAPLPPGTTVDCPWWGRDTPGNAALSDALEFAMDP